jgi:hypothetical protein
VVKNASAAGERKHGGALPRGLAEALGEAGCDAGEQGLTPPVCCDKKAPASAFFFVAT